MRATILILIAVLVIDLAASESGLPYVATGTAWADDDDNGGGKGRGGGGRGRGGGREARGNDDDDDGPRRTRQRVIRREAPARAPAPTPAPAPAPPPPAFRNEIVVLGLSEPDLATLVSQGFTVTETQEIASLGGALRRLEPPSGVSLPQAREAVRATASGQNADFNHFYRPEAEPECQGEHCSAFQQVGWQPPSATQPLQTCAGSPRIGMIDTGINIEHESLRGRDITLHKLGADEGKESEAMHGTAVAALLAGAPDSRTPGLVPDLPLVAVDAFRAVGDDERTDAFVLIRALAILADEDVDVINLSLSGPHNLMLEETLTQLIRQERIIVVASAGNKGPRADPQWPAAHPAVIAVTAVDREGNVYRRAGRGRHVTLAAPGVAIWTAASISGGRPKTGTSFAAPFVTAAAARVLESQPDLRPWELRTLLNRSAIDLGEPGRDPVYGWGLVAIPPGC